eukprot:4983579-Pleurochrysis_carterae.AAC.1
MVRLGCSAAVCLLHSVALPAHSLVASGAPPASSGGGAPRSSSVRCLPPLPPSSVRNQLLPLSRAQ